MDRDLRARWKQVAAKPRRISHRAAERPIHLFQKFVPNPRLIRSHVKEWEDAGPAGAGPAVPGQQFDPRSRSKFAGFFGEIEDTSARPIHLFIMRLYGPIFDKTTDPNSWIEAVKRAGYTAANVPLPMDALEGDVQAYLDAAQANDIVIAEVGAWSNPIDPDPTKAAEAIALCKQSLAWAERIGARCCVNIAGSRNPKKWDGPHVDNFSKATFDLIVETTQEIIDAVQPTRTFFTLETMPWIFPSSPDEYLDLIRAIDRPGFAVHLDPVNMMNSLDRVHRNADFLHDCFSKLGPHIKCCHAKDVILREDLTLHIDECQPGLGVLDYGVFLTELAKLNAVIPLGLEHLATAEEYMAAADYIRGIEKNLL